MRRRPAKKRAAPVTTSSKRCCGTVGLDDKGKRIRCTAVGAIYAMNAWFCEVHDPKGDPLCSHSLGRERCAYCGARLTAGS